MDLSLFHPAGKFVKPNAPLNILNSATRRLPCQFLEWTGWYSGNIKLRLLGHYRLFQLYKKHNGDEYAGLPLIENYILHYRSLHGIKYLVTRTLVFMCSLLTPAETISFASIEEMNRTLLDKKPHILKQFLEKADEDFAAALSHALRQIRDLSFLSNESDKLVRYTPDTPPVINNIQVNRFHTQYFNNTNIYNVSNGQPPVKGRQKGIFSKHQVLMFFDLLAQNGSHEKLNHSNPNKFKDIAEFLRSITGNPIDAWIQELNDRRGNDLYKFHTRGQVDQLIRDLTTISQQTRKAGLHTIAEAADRKIVGLEQQKATL